MSTPKITGLCGAESIPEGATLVRSYWTVPEHASYLEFPSKVDALEAAIERAETAKGRSSLIDFEPRVCIELRWRMQWTQDPDNEVFSAGIDTGVERWEFETIDGARAALHRIVTLSKRPIAATPQRARREQGL